MKFNNYIFIIFLIIFLLGCKQVQEGSEQETIEIISENGIEETEGNIDAELEKEFNDGLDEALAELEQIENI